MRTRLRDDLTTAMKARDRVAVAALRSALAAIENAEAVPVDAVPVDAVPVEGAPASRSGSRHVAGAGLGSAEAPRRDLSDDDVRAIVEREVTDRVMAAQDYRGRGQDDAAQRLEAEADVLSRHLVMPREGPPR